jgi:uncharacterized protein
VPELRAPSRHRLVRWALLAAGGLLVGIGVLGVFLPLLPSTIFFLGAAACFGKSSPAAHRWLTTNRWFGEHLHNYQSERGATVPAKVFSIASLWIGIGISEYFFIENMWVRVALLVIAALVTIHLVRLRTVRR